MVPILRFSDGSRAMPSKVFYIGLAATLVATSSCSVTEQGNHAVRKFWIDYNTLRNPAMYVEQVDHLPYPAPQVGYYRWMYDKDPGHQLACLGNFPPPQCKTCDPLAMPPAGEPFEYQVLYPTGMPGPTDRLWSEKLPEPINLSSATAPGEMASSPGPSPPSGRPSMSEAIPILPPPSAPVNGPNLSAPPFPGPTLSNPQTRPISPEPVDKPAASPPPRLPVFDVPVPVPEPKPVEQNVPPVFGPSSNEDSSVRLTTGQQTPGQQARSNPLSDPSIAWPR